MSFLQSGLLNDLTAKAKISESRHIRAKIMARAFFRSPFIFQKPTNERKAAEPVTKNIDTIHLRIDLLRIDSFGFLGFSSITPAVSCSVVRAISGKPSSTRLIQSI